MNTVLKLSVLAATAISVVAGVSSTSHSADLYTAPPEPVVQQNDDYVSGWYVRGDAGYSWLDVSGMGDGGAAIAGGGVGYQVNRYFRADVRADHAFAHESGLGYDVSGTTVLLNGYVDVPVGMGFTPYVGLGAGYGWANYSGGGAPADDNGFAWAATGGVAFDISQNVTLDAGYRYREIDVAGPNYADHAVTAGIRWNF